MKFDCKKIPVTALACASLASVAPAHAETSTADRAIELLRAANEARAENAAEAQRWQEEQARLRLLVQSLRDEARRIEARAADLRAEIERLEARQEAEGPRGDRLAALERLARAQVERIHDALDALEGRALPGAVPERGDAADADLEAARARLEAAERRAEQVTVELADGRLDGESLRVELLRVGGAVGWWCSLDGTSAGVAQVRQGALQLEPPPEPRDAEAILSACRIAKGRAAPELVTLPVRTPEDSR